MAHSPRALFRAGLLASSLGLACALASASARADEASAEDRAAAAREFAEGQRAFGAGDYKLAAEQFEAAYKHKPHHAPLWNAARARQRMGDAARAANLYARYLREAPPSTRDRNTAISALQKLSAKLGQLEITSVGLEAVKVDREPAMDKNVYVNPGAHVVEAKVAGQGRLVTQPVSVEAGQTQSVALVAPSEEPKTTPPVAAPAPPPRPDPSRPKEHGGLPPAAVYVGLGLTVAAGALTTFSALDVQSQKATFDKDPTQANLDLGKSKQLRTNILLGVTGGLGVLTGACAIWLVDWHSGDRAVQVGAGPFSLRLRGTF